MLQYLINRILLLIPMLLGITLISFMVIHLAPGSPTDIQTMMNPKASLEAQKRLRELYGLDKPLHVQYCGLAFPIGTFRSGKIFFTGWPAGVGQDQRATAGHHYH